MLTTTVATFEFHVLDAYLAFPAAPPAHAPSDLPATPLSPSEADRLAARFGPELARSLAASIVAVAHVSVTAEHYRAAHPAAALQTADAAREPSLRIVALAQAFMAAPSFGPADIAPVVAAFAEHAADFAIPLSAADRALFASSFAAIGEKLADSPGRHDLTRDLTRFVTELHAAPCGPLCAQARK